jgi:hypothetical protein
MAIKIQNYLITILVLAGCSSATDRVGFNSINYKTEAVLVADSKEYEGMEAIIVPSDVMKDVTKDENADNLFFVDIRIAQKWTPDSSLSQDKVKHYLAFQMFNNINLIGSDTLKPLFAHFEDFFGIRNFNVLHLAFPADAKSYKEIQLEHDNPLWPHDHLKFRFNQEAIQNS